MRFLLSLVFIPWVAVTCAAAEIVSWKVPLSRFVGSGVDAQGIVRCKSAPEASPFFKQGDELWDLKGVVREDSPRRSFLVDWLVWNATSGRIVGKGNWTALWTIHEMIRPDEMSKQCRIFLSLYDVAADGKPPFDDAKPLVELSLLTRSGQNSEATWCESGKSMKVETMTTIDETKPSAYIGLKCSVEVPAQSRLELDTSFRLEAGKPLWIARDFDGKKGLDLRVDCKLETFGGTPADEIVMIQHEAKMEKLMPDWRKKERRREGEGWVLDRYLDHRTLVSMVFGEEAVPIADPFASPGQVELKPFPGLPLVKSPDYLKLDHQVLDMTEWLDPLTALPKAKGNLAFYDPIFERIYLYLTDEEALKLAEFGFEPMCGVSPENGAISLDGNGQMRLMTRSGQRASLSRIEGEKSVQRYLEAEPTIGEDERLIDIRLHYENVADPQHILKLKTSHILLNGEWLKLFSGTGNDVGTSSLQLKVEVLRSWMD